MTKAKKTGFVAWLFRDKHGKVVVFEMPNTFLLIALAAWLCLQILKAPNAHLILEIIFNASLIAWAALEIGWGTTRFRQLLGTVVLAWIMIGLLKLWLL